MSGKDILKKQAVAKRGIDLNPFDNIGHSITKGILLALETHPPLAAAAKGRKVRLVIEVTFQLVPE